MSLRSESGITQQSHKMTNSDPCDEFAYPYLALMQDFNFHDLYELHHEKTRFLPKHCTADLHLCFRYSDNTIPLLLKSKIPSFWLASVSAQTGFCQTWMEPEDQFSHAVAYITLLTDSCIIYPCPKTISLWRTVAYIIWVFCSIGHVAFRGLIPPQWNTLLGFHIPYNISTNTPVKYIEPPHGKTNNLYRRKQRRRSASR